MNLTDWFFHLYYGRELRALGMKTDQNTKVRPMRPADIDAVLEVSKVSSDDPLTREELVIDSQDLSRGGLVCDWYGGVFAAVLFELRTTCVRVLAMPVDPDAPRYQLAGALLDALKEKLTGTRTFLFLSIDRNNEEAEAWLRGSGFKFAGVESADRNLAIYCYTRKD
jgi:hypothetical protein